jgi:hypothetical protein
MRGSAYPRLSDETERLKALLNLVSRIVQHVFGEIALLLVGVSGGVAALNVAVFATGDIFRRAGLNIVGATERIVVADITGHRDIAAVRAARERQSG